MSSLEIISYLLGLPCVVATALSLSKKSWWWIRILDFPRLQVAFVLLSAMGLYAAAPGYVQKNSILYLGLLGATLLFHTLKIWPYTRLHPLQSKNARITDDSRNQLSLVYSNVLMTNRDKEACLREMLRYKPDLILAVETDAWWQGALKPLESEYPYTKQLPMDNTYGMMLYSKLPLERAEFQYLVEKDVPSLNPLITLPSGQKVDCFFIHPRPPVPGESLSSEERDAELILVARKARESAFPVIVAGDLNDVGWSYTSTLFQKISRLLDPRVGRGLYATYNAKSLFFRWPLDHVFHSTHFRVIELKKLEKMGSDHFPIYIRLSFEPEGRQEQPLLKASKEEEIESSEKTGKAYG
jgi:endonuclease/exonuclease/phosphatase (EEP) superfamily protein YafD